MIFAIGLGLIAITINVLLIAYFTSRKPSDMDGLQSLYILIGGGLISGAFTVAMLAVAFSTILGG